VAALIDVSETVRHRLQCPIELSRIVNAAEQRRISRGDGRMSHIFNDRSDKSADGLRRHQKKLSCYSWSSGDRVATSAYDLTSLPVRASISSSWIDRTEFRNSGQLNISGQNLANSRSIVSSVTARSDSSESRAMRSSLSGSLNIVPLNVSNPHVLQVAGEHIDEYPLQTRNVCETAAGFVADRTRTACCRDPDRQ
jgi:hypothetical protein